MTSTPWKYGDYTIWGWAVRTRHRPRRCHTRAMKSCQRRVNRVPEIAGTEVVELVRAAKSSEKKG